MNRKAHSLFLCALLASTYVHDFNVKASPSTVAGITNSVAGSATKSPYNCNITECEYTTFEDTTSEATTDEVSPASAFSSSIILTIFGNDKANILGIANITTKTSFLIDANDNIIALLNAETQKGVIINLKSNRGVYVTKKNNVVKDSGIKEYLESLKSLKPLLGTKGATKFKVYVESKEILDTVNEILVSLIDNLEDELRIYPTVGRELIMALGSKYVKLLNGDMKGLPKVLGSSGITVRTNLAGLTNNLEAIGNIVDKLGGYSVIEEAGVEHDVQKLADGGDGFEILNIFLLAIGTKLDVGEVLGDLLNNPETALKFLAQLGGNSNIGVDGMLKVVANIVGLIKKQVPLEIVLNVLIQFLGANKGNDKGRLIEKIKNSINDLLVTLNEVNAKDSLVDFVDTLTKLRDGELVIDGVDVSQILDRSLEGLKEENLLQVLVSVLSLLESVVSLEVLFPLLLIVLILDVDSPLGISLLKGIGLLLDFTIGGTIPIIGGILKLLLSTVAGLLQLLDEGIPKALGELPAIRELVAALEKALTDSSIGIDLQSLLFDPEVTDLMTALLQSMGDLVLDASIKSVQKVRKIRKNCGSVNSLLDISLDVQIRA